MKVLRKIPLQILLLVIGASGIGLSVGGTSLKSEGREEISRSKTDSLENVISTVRESLTVEPVIKPELPKETPCDSAMYFRKGVSEGLKHCPVHKDKPCLPEPCPPHKLELLEVGFVENKTKWKVISTCGVDCTEVIKIGVKPDKGN